jgi:hypothetical protein
MQLVGTDPGVCAIGITHRPKCAFEKPVCKLI